MPIDKRVFNTTFDNNRDVVKDWLPEILMRILSNEVLHEPSVEFKQLLNENRE